MVYSEADLKRAFIAGYVACHEDYDMADDTVAAAEVAWEAANTPKLKCPESHAPAMCNTIFGCRMT